MSENPTARVNVGDVARAAVRTLSSVLIAVWTAVYLKLLLYHLGLATPTLFPRTRQIFGVLACERLAIVALPLLIVLTLWADGLRGPRASRAWMRTGFFTVALIACMANVVAATRVGAYVAAARPWALYLRIVTVSAMACAFIALALSELRAGMQRSGGLVLSASTLDPRGRLPFFVVSGILSAALVAVGIGWIPHVTIFPLFVAYLLAGWLIHRRFSR